VINEGVERKMSKRVNLMAENIEAHLWSSGVDLHGSDQHHGGFVGFS
jgi:hypothetical protein